MRRRERERSATGADAHESTGAAPAGRRRAAGLRRLAAPAVALALSACASLAPPPPRVEPADVACEAALDALARVLEREGLRDAQAAPVPGFAHLRVDRLHASLRDRLPAATGDTDAHAGARWAAWIDGLRRLADEARAHELARLPRAWRARGPELDACARRLAAADARDPARRAAVRARADVPSAYSGLARAIGLYPLTRIAFAAGVRGWERETRALFAAEPPRAGLRHWYPALGAPPPPAERAARLAGIARDALGVPRPDAAQRDWLLAAYAPVLVLERGGRFDDPGRLVATAGPEGRTTPHGASPTVGAVSPAVAAPPTGAGPTAVRVDTDDPVVYGRIAHTRVGEAVLLQLVYTAWFTERPPTGPLDLLSGHLDGIVLRFTLAEDGELLLVDTIHPCGCYHLFLPGAGLRERTRAHADDGSEWRFVPQRLGAMPAAARVRAWLQSRTHYLRRVDYAGGGDVASTYRLADDDTLRSLPVPGSARRRSVFGPDGLVPGTARAERFLFWPMGVASAGAMRQWGHHATAFVGRRDFDDPRLVDERFERVADLQGERR